MSFEDILVRLAAPLYLPFADGQRLHWSYLCSALVIALALYWLSRRPGAGLKGALLDGLRFAFPKSVFLHPSATLDYRFFYFVVIADGLVVLPLVLFAPGEAEAVRLVLSDAFGTVDASTGSGLWARALYTLCHVLAFDLGIFITHYLQHRIPLLWEFHKVHHSAEVLTPVTLFRMHPVDKIFTGVTVAVFTGAVGGVFAYLFGGAVDIWTVGALNVVLFAFYLLGYNLRHSHVWLSYPPWLSRLLISPAQHQIHHSSAARHLDKNMGFVFAFWDRVFGTLYVPLEREQFDMGLTGGEHAEYRSVLALFALPFVKAARRLRRLG